VFDGGQLQIKSHEELMGAGTARENPYSHFRTRRGQSPFPPRKRLWVLIPLIVQASARKEIARLSISGAFRRACARSPVFWAPERVWRQGKRGSVSGAAKNLATECVRSFQWKDGQNRA
jgi:hypothetical protein